MKKKERDNNMEFPYTIADVLSMNNLPNNFVSRSIRIACPFCRAEKIEKNFGVDLDSEKFHCYKCGIQGRGGTQLHALLHGISTKEAYKEVMSYVGSNSYEKRDLSGITKEPIEVSQAEEASDIMKNNAYEKLLSLTNLSERHKQDLLSRGFKESEITFLNYSSYPKREEDKITEMYFSIPRLIMSKPEEGLNVKGVPGFYKTKNKGAWTMMNSTGGIVIPYRSWENKILGIQIRKNNEDVECNDNKYIWFSSMGKNEGCKQRTCLHYACDYVWDENDKDYHPLIKKNSLCITEGALKGDLAHCLSGIPFVCVPGVSSANAALKQDIPKWVKAGVEQIFLCFDIDMIMNINVSKALDALKSLITSYGIKVLLMTWDMTYYRLDKSTDLFNGETDFVFTPDSLKKSIERGLLDEHLEKLSQIGKQNIFFAAVKSDELKNKQNQDNYKVLREKCKVANLSCTPCFWGIVSKGIDDYFARKKLEKREP